MFQFLSRPFTHTHTHTYTSQVPYSPLSRTYLWWGWSSRIWHTSGGWEVARGLLRGVASWPRWVASSRGIGHLQQKTGKQDVTVQHKMNLKFDLVCTSCGLHVRKISTLIHSVSRAMSQCLSRLGHYLLHICFSFDIKVRLLDSRGRTPFQNIFGVSTQMFSGRRHILAGLQCAE